MIKNIYRLIRNFFIINNFGETIMTSSELSELVLLLENKLPITGIYPRIGNLLLFFVSVFDKTPDSIKVCPSFTL